MLDKTFVQIFAAVFCFGVVMSEGELPWGDPNLRCNPGGCVNYTADPNNNQCPKNGFLDLAHPGDINKYCRCDHAASDICEMSCAPGTHFNASVWGCDSAEITQKGACRTNPCGVDSVSCGGATLASSPIPWSCQCKTGSFGWNCQFSGDPCATVKCGAGTSCVNEVASWWPVYVPYKCKVTDPCSPNPCEGGGSCSPDENAPLGYTCQCVTGHHGNQCQCTSIKYTDHCALSPCQNGGTCESPVDGDCFQYKCVCPYNYIGQHCENQDCPDSVCLGLDNHLRPHPTECNRYCSCSAQKAHVFDCPPGTFFSTSSYACADDTCTQILTKG